ncbi:MAG: PP2C family protein-serine/threonine phosphatase [Dongiaceae bacterium]
MKKKRSNPPGRSRGRAATRDSASPLLRQLDEALRSLNPEADPSQVAQQIVCAARGLGLAGARLWRLADGKPSVWYEEGEVPPADSTLRQIALSPESFRSNKKNHWSALLSTNGRPLGLLEVCSRKPFTEEARRALELFGRYAAVALASTERRHVVQELSSIVEATKRLNSTLDLGELINIILQLATRQTSADRGTVFLVNHERQEIWSLVGLGLEQHEIRLPITKGISGWVARSGETVNLPDAYADPRFEPDVDRRLGYKTGALLCLPIRNKDAEIVGVLQLLNKRAGPFTSADESFLRALSDHVALALENAQLHRELLAKQRLERDLALARSIQRGLLPEHPPQLEGFDLAVSHTPSQMVGGDYYDFVPLNDSTMLTVIADVEGKGVASALVMANLQATIRALVTHVHSLERIVSLVNEMILTDTRGGKFMTMFAGLLDHRHRGFHYVNAGHVPPAVVRPNGETVLLSAGGIVVGIFPGSTYERGFVRLEPGDIVVACTDGITEAMDRQENEYGLERLTRAVHRQRDLPAPRIVENVLAEVDEYSRGGPHDDDRVLLVLKVV